MAVETEEKILKQNDILTITKIAKESEKIKIYLFVKRIIDIVLSLIGLIVLSPVFLLLSTLIRINSKGPIIFTHERIGKDGKSFKMYKFRTMHEDAQDMKKYLTPEQQEEWKQNYKLENDPRITKIGSFLRKTSLDELPQIINILNGELSIVGPRPVIQEELEMYGENKEKFLSVTPGLTGNWACNGRNNITYEERMEQELYYIDNISWKLDTKIFFKTIITVLKKEGAM